jgi:asparagine synthase (glutamine-hydrolysing)
VLEQYVPSRLFERPKTGFGVPIGAWLRAPLRGWADELLDPARLERAGYLRPAPIRELWKQQLPAEAIGPTGCGAC